MDCASYIELFFFEELFSQFSHLSVALGICSFQKSPSGDWFKIIPWWSNSPQCHNNDGVKFSFGSDKKFHVDNEHLQLSLVPSLTFNSNEALDALKNLFEVTFVSKLNEFFVEIVQLGFLVNFSFVLESFMYHLTVADSLILSFSLNHVSRKLRAFVNNFESEKHFQDELELMLYSFNKDAFLDMILHLKRNHFIKALSANSSEWIIMNSCKEISPKNDFCITLRQVPSIALSLRLDLNHGLKIEFWSLHCHYLHGFMNMKYTQIFKSSNCKISDFIPIPLSNDELFDILRTEKSTISSLASNFSFHTILSENHLNGEFINPCEFQIFSFGLPQCISKVSLLFSGREATLHALLLIHSGQSFSFSTPSYPFHECSNLILLVKSIIRFFSIFEFFQSLEMYSVNLVSVAPLQFSFNNVFMFSLNLPDCKIEVSVSGQLMPEIEKFCDNESFCDFYSLLDLLLAASSTCPELRNSAETSSTDFNWLSDSFI